VEVLVPAAAAAKATLQGGGGGAAEAKLPHGKSAAAEKHLVATPSTVPGTDLYPDERPGAAPTGPGTGSGKARPEGEVVIATLGPGDFFGETGLLEGRQKRGASVLCTSDVEVMAMDKEVFKQVAGSGETGNKLADSMREKADALQRARLSKVFDMMNMAAHQRRNYSKGQVVFHQGAPADHFYIVNRGELGMMANTPDGRAVRVKRLKTGDHFGYDALLAATHDTTVSCLSEVELTAVPQEELRLASDQDGYLGETMQAQRSKREAALQAAVEQQEEAQILPMMAKAAVKGDGVEYDKYEAMIAQMHKVSFKSDDCVFRQGDPATAVYLVTAGTLEVDAASSATTTEPPSANSKTASSSNAAGKSGASSGRTRVIATLRPGDHFGETALLEERKLRNTTVRCVSPACELREMPNAMFLKCLNDSKQLAASVHAAAENRNNRRVRKIISAAEEQGKASALKLRPGEILFRQGDRSSAFYVIESGEVQMTLTPATDDNDPEAAESIPTRKYHAGECFGASGLMPGDSYRRDTATAVGPVTLKVIPHKHFHVMLRDDKFLKAGLQASSVLHSKRRQAEELSQLDEIDEQDDEVVQRAMRK